MAAELTGRRGSPLRVAIVGGGAIGLTTARVLVQRSPRAEVVVIERGRLGAGASGHAGAIDIPFFQTARHRDLVERSQAWYAGQPGADGFRVAAPMHWTIATEEAERSLRSFLLDEPVATGTAMPGTPGWRVPDGSRVLTGTCHVIDPASLCGALRDSLLASGRARVLEGTTLTALEVTDRDVHLRLADGVRLQADYAVIAAGPWVLRLPVELAAWAAQLGVRTKRVFGLRVGLDEAVRCRHAIGHRAEGVYFFPTSCEYGMSVRHDVWDVEPDAPGAMADEVLDRAARFLDAVVGRGRWTITGHRVFADTYTADGMPFAGAGDRLGPRVVLVTGTHGSGIRLAPGLAMEAAAPILAP